jgi:sigma-B regulation protein RsbU (phosphoserine phosphatase)
LAVVSDGIFEAMNPAGEQFGADRLSAYIETCRTRPAAEVLEGLCAAVHAWQGPGDPLDDQTIVVVRRAC